MIVAKGSYINQSLQRETNISVVLRAIRADSECTRVKLAELTGLAPTSVTKIVAQLLEWGVVCERESIGEGVGRRAVRLRLNAEAYRVAAVRVNRRYLIAAVYDMAGRLCDILQRETGPEEGAQTSVERLIGMLKALLARSERPVMSVGVAVPGPFNYAKRRITLMSGFPGWSEIDIGAALIDALHMPVFVDQDANCGALAEMWFADSDPRSDMVFITADRGIGAGLLLNSSVYRGHDGFAGEIGHTSINVFGPRCECGNRGCLELYGSSVALENTYRQDTFDLAKPDSVAGDVAAGRILELTRAGDPAACRAYRKTISYLCFGVVGLINTLNPDTVVFADKIVNGGPLFLETAHSVFRQYLLPEIYAKLRVKVCTLEGDPMLLGASVLAFDSMLQTPSAYFARSGADA